MEIQPVNLPELAAVILGMMMVLIPIMGATVRFAARPLVEALMMSGLLEKRTGTTESTPELGRLTRRVVELEQELAQLKAGAPSGDLPMADLRRLRG